MKLATNAKLSKETSTKVNDPDNPAWTEDMLGSPMLKAELEARLAEFERNPDAGYSWDQVKARLKSGSWRSA
jgi:putative addiction module component (TIGR02574 family)